MKIESETQGPAKAHVLALFASLVGAGLISLSIHVVMLQVLGVPFPEANAPIWASFLNLVGTTTALIAFQIIARQKLGSWWRSVALSSIILFTLKESLRGAVMNGVITTAWVFALAGLFVPLLLSIGISAVCAISSRRVKSLSGLILAGLITGVIAFTLQIIIGAAVSPLMAALTPLAHPDVYQLPYPTIVLIPAYLTFAEPVIGCFVMVVLSWGQFDCNFPARLALFTLLVVLLKGVVIRTFLYPIFMALPFFQGVLSQSQFLLEFAALGALTATAWHLFGRKTDRGTPFAWSRLRSTDDGSK